MPDKKKIFIILLSLFSIFFIFYQYDLIPKGLTHDENEIARAAFSLENKSYTPFTPVADGHATVYLYSLLFSFNIFGINKFALRLPSRIYGILSVLFFYLILKIVYKNKKILNFELLILISIILLTSRWFLHFTRFSFEMPFLLLMELLSTYFLFSYFEKKQNLKLILSGIFSGLAFNSYQPGRIFFIIPLLFLIINKIRLKNIKYFLISFIIIILPISLYLIRQPASDIRINQQFFLKNSSLSIQTKAAYLYENLSKTISMFIFQGDMNGVHNYTGKPALNPILAVFFFIGLIVAIKRIKNYYNAFFIFYFFIALIPTILTYPWENPNMLRTYTALPSIIYFVGLTILLFFNYFNKLINIKWLKYLILTTLFLILAFSSYYDLRTYFKYQPLVFKQSFDKPDYLKIIRENAHRNDLWSF